MGKKLAIRGHVSRGKEVIELLEMLGGKNIEKYIGVDYDEIYTIEDGYIIQSYDWNDCLVLSLEGFLEKYPFKVGDKVEVYETGKVFTIGNMIWEDQLYTVHYANMEDIEYYTAKELKPYKEGSNIKDKEDKLFDSIIWHLRNSVNNGKQNLSGGECEDYFREVVKKNNENKMKTVLAELLEHIKTTPKEELEQEFKEIEEWSHVGPTVEEFRIFCECVNKKPTYPKTIEECVKLLGVDFRLDMDSYKRKLMANFYRLILCRDTYWKIAGEQMGLDKPWDSTYGCGEWGYWVGYSINENKIYLQDSRILVNHTLVFPTAEMRDAFYENFKDLIEQCKELL